MMFLTPDQINAILTFLISLIVATLAFYAAGRLLSGVNAKFTDAIFVALLGLLLKFGIDFTISFFLVPGLNEIVVFAWSVVSLLATFIVWMILVQHFFDTLFLRGLTIVIIAFILIFIIDFVMNFVFLIFFP
ncbi:MAG: hypothetical protein ACFFCH_09595 [Promethearchaeota archaeon]